MEFKKRLENYSPKLKGIIRNFSGHLQFIDEDDLMQEISIHLWEKNQGNFFNDKTESYIIQSCYFYLRNFLRKTQNEKRFLSIDEPIDESGTTFEEIICAKSDYTDEYIEEKRFFNKVMSNGLNRKEKDIFQYLYEGYTIREIGEKLNISHTMVNKHKKNILKKVSKECDFLLV